MQSTPEQEAYIRSFTRLQDVIHTLLLEVASVATFKEIEYDAPPYSKEKRKVTLQEYQSRPKKQQLKKGKKKIPFHAVTCNSCKEFGHIAANCPNRSFDPNDKDPVACSFCHTRGHTVDTCWAKHPELAPKRKQTRFDTKQKREAENFFFFLVSFMGC